MSHQPWNNCKGEKLTHPLAKTCPSRRYLQELNCFFTLFPHLLPSLIYKKPGIQALTRWLFWDISLPSSRSLSSLNKVLFLASTLLSLGLTGLLCGKKSELGLCYSGISFKLGCTLQSLAGLLKRFILKPQLKMK